MSSDQRDWDEHLQNVLFAYRISPSEATGESPFYLLYSRPSREPRLPLDVSLLSPVNVSLSVDDHRARVVRNVEEIHELARANIQRAQQRMKDYYDRNASPSTYVVGSKVWVYRPKTRKGLSKKLLHNWHGPYRIVMKLSPVHYKLRASDNRRISTTVHSNRLKPYVDPNDRPLTPPDANDAYLSEVDFPADSLNPQVPPTIPPMTLSCPPPYFTTSRPLLDQSVSNDHPIMETQLYLRLDTLSENAFGLENRNT